MSEDKNLATEFPEIAKEWNYEKNSGKKPEDFAVHSNKTVWWICKYGHEWQAKIGGRTGKQHSGCPYCSNRKVAKGVNDLLSKNPKICEEWNYEKNDIKPDEIIASSPKKVWWKCSEGHSYLQKVYDHNIKGRGCPYCRHQRMVPEYNSLAAKDPVLAQEWDYEKNYPITPSDVLYGGNKKYWWKCKKQPHSFLASVKNRIDGSQCPYCSSQALLTGFNDLETRNPDVLDKWDYDKNAPLTPKDVMAYSNIKVWWKCPDCGHEWKTGINAVSSGTGCPKCSSGYKVSESEHIIYYYTKKVFEDAEITYHADWLGSKEIDIYIPSIKLAIEYDGDFWHKPKANRDIKKSLLIKENGNDIIRFREERLTPIEDGSYVITVPSKRYDLTRLNDPIKEMFQHINEFYGMSINVDVDVDRDWKEILSSKLSVKKERSLAAKYPDLAKTWNYEKNKGLLPENFFPGSNKKVWWKCPDCGYEWEETIVNRTKRQSPCRKCHARDYTNKKLFVGINDIVTLYPEHVEEWNWERNGDLNPENYTRSSHKKVWWRCKECGHEWRATISNKTYGFGCPVCARKKAANTRSENAVKTGINDFYTLNPDIAKEWDYEKNYPLTPDNISAHSNRKVWWRCPVCENEWQATIVSRLRVKGCPFCKNRRFKKGFNDIFSQHPELINEWDYEKNADIDPTSTIVTSPKKVWWKCSNCGNEWITDIRARCIRGTGCPVCNHQKGFETRHKEKVASGDNLLVKHPEIAKQWHPTKNGTKTPADVTPRSGYKFWWICDKGHEWQATVSHRVSGTGCPICSNRIILAGYNDLQTLNPQLAKEWNYEKNGDLTPEKVGVYYSKKVWWKCEHGHEWQTTVGHRTSGNSCPICANKMIVPGINDLATVNPEVAKDWDNDKNNGLLPTMFSANSDKRIWWKCHLCGHEWQSSIENRNYGRKCPRCKGKGIYQNSLFSNEEDKK